MNAQLSIAIEREPENTQTHGRPHLKVPGRSFVPPDAANPGPIARFYPLEGDSEDDSSGYDSFGDQGESQNQDRI